MKSRRRIVRILLRAAAGIAALALLLAAALAFLIGTQTGTRFLFGRLGALLPGTFAVRSAAGRIDSPLTLEGVVYKRPGTEIRIDRLVLEWRLRELLNRRIDIGRLYADGVRVTSTPTPNQQPSALPDLDLRFNVLVRDARVRGLTLGSGGASAAAPTVIDEIDLATTDIDNLVRIDRLAVRSALLRADVTGTVQPRGDYPVDLALRWEAHPGGTPTMAAVAGGGTLRGSLADLHVEQRLTAPFDARLAAALHQPMRQLSFDGRLELHGVNPRRLRADLPDLPASGEVSIKGDVSNFESWGEIAGTMAPAGNFRLAYRVGRRGDAWQVRQADLTLPGAPSRLALRGLVTLAGGDWRFEKVELAVPGTPARLAASGLVKQRGQGFDVEAALDWRELAWPPTGLATVRSRQGHARLAGSLDSFRARVAADLAAGAAPPGMKAGSFTLSGTGSRDRFHIDSLAAGLLSGRVQGRGDVSWSPRLAWNLSLSGQGIDPAAVRPDLPGRLAFDLSTRGESGPGGLAGSVELPRLQGSLRGQTVAASAALRLSGATYDLSRLDAQWGTARLRASGRLGDRLDLAFDAQAPNLGLVVTAATGSVTASGHVAGTAKAPRVQASAHVHGFRFGTQSVGDATLSADVDLAAAGPFQLDADLRDVNAGGQLVSRLTVQTRGTTASHTLALSASGLGDEKSARMDLGLAGGVSGPLGAGSTWRGQISRLDLRSSPVGDWSLQQAATLEAAAAAVRLRDLCWIAVGGGAASSGPAPGGAATGKAAGAPSNEPGAGKSAAAAGARLCASAAWSQAGPWAGEATLAALPLDLLKPFLPPDLAISGEVNGKAAAHGGSQGIAGADIDLSPGPGDLRFPAEQGRMTTVHFERGTLRVQAGPAGGDATAALVLTNVGTFDARLRLPRLTQGVVLRQQPLGGTITAHVRDLTFLEGFVPDLRRLAGSLDADLKLAGTAAEPRVTGQARLAGGRAQVPLYGLDLQDVHLTATADGGPTLAIDAGARSGSGTLRITGSAGLMPSAAAPVHLAVTGNRFEVMGTRDIRILVTPDLKVEYQGTAAKVTGQVTIPEAHIHVEKAPAGGPIQPSKDVVFVGGLKPQAQQPAKTPLALSTRVRLVIPNPSIELDAFGLKGQPYGTLLLVENPGSAAATGTGELDIAPGGTFQAYGQNLTIVRGRLIFGGPVDDPALDIRASRLSDDSTVTAGIEARGTLEQPTFAVWSTPAMGQSDALSYVMLGHGLHQASQQEGNRVANAASSLGLAGAGMLAKSVGARFGLEQASIESSGNLNQASLVLGKYLAPHLYVIYGIGLFQPVSTFRVRYIINSKWTLQAESSTETGADILYTLERGKNR